MANLLVIVSYKVFPAHMGGQKGIVLFYQYLKEHHSIHMAVSDDNYPDTISYWVEKMLYANNRMASNLFRLSALRQWIREKNIHCIIAEHSYTGWIGLLLRTITGTPFIIHSHNNEASRFRQMGKRGWKLFSRYEKWIHRKADFNFFKTEEERQNAIHDYALNQSRCAVISYGVEINKKSYNAKEQFQAVYGIHSTNLFYFNGTLDYKPNAEAVERLIENIDPLLLKTGIEYTILITGKRLSPLLQERIKATKTIRYLHFIEDVSLLYQASTLFVNPVVNDSGVKTKVVEALANHCTVVSTRSGATGIPNECSQGKLVMAEDNDWNSFVNQILDCLQQPSTQTPSAFFANFSWKNIAQKAAAHIEDTLQHA